jgi:RsmE family RNA methyltransferase
VPDVAVHPRLMPLLDAPPPWPTAARRVIAHPRAARALEDVAPPGDAGPLVLAIGPDGGWIERELASFAERGFAAARLGDAVLRTDHAVTAALAQLGLLARLGGCVRSR